MFWTIYKTSIKNLLRSLLFWFALALLLGLSLHRAIEGGLNSDYRTGYVMSFINYVQVPINVCKAWLVFYPLPIFTVISAALQLNRDYGDSFYEIERAGNIKPSCYLFGRLTALVTVNLIVALITMFAVFYCYTFTHGGVVKDMTWGSFVCDSFVRLMRCYICTVVPAILMYIGWTCMIGNLFKSGLAAAAGGLGYVLLTYLFDYQLRFRMPDIYHDFLSPYPKKLLDYLVYYDSQWFETVIKRMNTSFEEAVFGAAILLTAAVLWSAVSYWRIRRRRI